MVKVMLLELKCLNDSQINAEIQANYIFRSQTQIFLANVVLPFLLTLQ